MNHDVTQLTDLQLTTGYEQSKYWLGEFEQELAELKRQYLPAHPDLFESFSYGTTKQISDLQRDLAEYKRELTARRYARVA